MVTMRDAVKQYQQRYFGDSNMQDMKNIDAVIPGETSHHDIFHVIASGVALLGDDEDVAKKLQFMDEKGLVARNTGLKAEIISDIYNLVITDNVTTEAGFNYVGRDGVIPKERLNALHELGQREIKQKDKEGAPLSEIPAVAEMKNKYHSLRSGEAIMEQLINHEEVQFHVRKAIELNLKLRAEHPECLASKADIDAETLWGSVLRHMAPKTYLASEAYNGKNYVDLEKLLDLPLEAFQIDNFRTTEKAMLGDALKGKGGGVSLP